MATITIENVPENIVNFYGTKINFDYNLFNKKDLDIDFKELDSFEITEDILKSIEKTKNTEKSKFINLSKEYANY